MHAVSGMQAPHRMGVATHGVDFVVHFAVGRMPTLGLQGCVGYWFGKCQTAGFVLVYHLVYGIYSRNAKEHAICLRTV
jgi:hypothetical protein